jgi:hypothetical protein
MQFWTAWRSRGLPPPGLRRELCQRLLLACLVSLDGTGFSLLPWLAGLRRQSGKACDLSLVACHCGTHPPCCPGWLVAASRATEDGRPRL